jgi:hypothetical protein
MKHLALHEHMLKHMPGDTKISRFNRNFAAKITKFVGSMACAYVFSVLALLSLPAVLSNFAIFAHVFPAALVKASLIALIAWIAQTFLQLVLLSVIMVGQDVQSQASAEQMVHTETNTDKLVDLMSLETESGLKVVYNKLVEIEAKLK